MGAGGRVGTAVGGIGAGVGGTSVGEGACVSFGVDIGCVCGVAAAVTVGALMKLEVLAVIVGVATVVVLTPAAFPVVYRRNVKPVTKILTIIAI